MCGMAARMLAGAEEQGPYSARDEHSCILIDRCCNGRMILAEQYARQYRWRSWHLAYDALPPLRGARVLDLGCGIGDQAGDLAASGAQLVGVDGNADLIAYAQSRNIPGAVFHLGDVREPAVEGPFDGIWASFVPAYFPDFAPVLAHWKRLLRPGGWIALTEMAGLFRHEPLAPQARALLDSFVREAQGYDFDMGDKLAEHLAHAGFEVRCELVLPDQELSFSGPAAPDVLEAWRQRLRRLAALQARASNECPALEDDVVRCMSSPAHVTDCKVHFSLAVCP